MNWHVAEDDGYRASVALVAAVAYTAPAAALALVLGSVDAAQSYLVPALIIYAIAAFTHLIARGFLTILVEVTAIRRSLSE